MYDMLFSPVKIRGMELKNRVIFLPWVLVWRKTVPLPTD